MPKGKADTRFRTKPAHKPEQAGALQRRARTQPESVAGTPRRRPSAATRLAAEVERLQQELEAARREMAVLAARADIDPLTDLANRRAFERELSRSLAYVKRHGTSAALLFVDLDDFKQVNDRHGHAAGDSVLRAVARVLGRHVRASDVVARIGGDEFAVLLWNCDEANALAKARTLEEAVERTTAMHEGAALTVGASIGAASLFPLDQPAEVFDRADRAMYARKTAHTRAAE